MAQAEQPDLQRWARKFGGRNGLGDSMLDSRLDSRLGPDSRIGDARPAGHDKAPVARYVGRLR